MNFAEIISLSEGMDCPILQMSGVGLSMFEICCENEDIDVVKKKSESGISYREIHGMVVLINPEYGDEDYRLCDLEHIPVKHDANRDEISRIGKQALMALFDELDDHRL